MINLNAGGDGTIAFINAASGTAGTYISTFTEKMRITSGGTVIVKGQNDDIVQVGDSISGHNAYLQLKAGSGGNAYVNSTGSGSLILGANGAASNHLQITSGGNVLIGTTSDDARLTVQPSGSGYGQVINHTNATNQYFISFRYNTTTIGTITGNNTNTAYNTSGSDLTIKKNFENWTENVSNYFASINPQKFHFLNQNDDEEKVKGFIAQEMVDKFPEAYPLMDNGKYMFNPSGMVVYLMKAIQELKAEIDTLKK
jgi:hypothetical protein